MVIQSGLSIYIVIISHFMELVWNMFLDIIIEQEQLIHAGD